MSMLVSPLRAMSTLPTTVRQATTRNIAAMSTALRRSSARTVRSPARSVKKSTMMCPPFAWQ